MALGAWCVGDRMALWCIVGVLQQVPGLKYGALMC